MVRSHGERFLGIKGLFTAGKVQAYPDFDSNEPFILTTDLTAFNIASVLSQKQKVPQIRETLSIYEGRTIGFSEEHGEMEAYPEVLAPLFNLQTHPA